MDDYLKKTLEQARSLSLASEIARTTNPLRGFGESQSTLATRQYMDDLDRQERLRKSIYGGFDIYADRITGDYLADQEKLRAIQGVAGLFSAEKNMLQTRVNAVSDLLGPWTRSDLSTGHYSHSVADVVTVADRMRAIMGPAYELGTRGAHLQASSALQDMLLAQERQFVVPDVDLVRRLADEASRMNVYPGPSDLASAAVRMTHPWLDPDIATQSFKAFSDLQSIGSLATGSDPFSDATSGYLRDRLGDWRDPVSGSDIGLDDIAVRAAFYADRGFDTELVEMPPAAFEESIQIGGLVTVRVDLVAVYGEPVPLGGPDTETAFERTNRAHKWLTRFEHAFRRYIHSEMVAKFGSDWPKHKVSKEIRDKWAERRDKAPVHEVGALLIDYAELPDYEQFIFARDVWPLFQPQLINLESARESLRRMYPIRNPVMHGRAISLSDELVLFNELQRLTRLFMNS